MTPKKLNKIIERAQKIGIQPNLSVKIKVSEFDFETAIEFFNSAECSKNCTYAQFKKYYIGEFYLYYNFGVDLKIETKPFQKRETLKKLENLNEFLPF